MKRVKKKRENDTLKQRKEPCNVVWGATHISRSILTVAAVFPFWLIALRCTFHLQSIMKNKYVYLLRKTETADNPESWRWALHISLLVGIYYFFFRNNYLDEQQLLYAMTCFIKKRNESWMCSWLLYCWLFRYVIEFTCSLMELFCVFRYRALPYLW